MSMRILDPMVGGAARGTLITVLVTLAIVVGAVLWLRGPGPMEFAPGQKVALAEYHATDPTGVPAALKDATQIARGEYLARAADCMVCHTSPDRSEEHTSELQSRRDLVCRLLLEKKKKKKINSK